MNIKNWIINILKNNINAGLEFSVEEKNLACEFYGLNEKELIKENKRLIKENCELLSEVNKYKKMFYCEDSTSHTLELNPKEK